MTERVLATGIPQQWQHHVERWCDLADSCLTNATSDVAELRRNQGIGCGRRNLDSSVMSATREAVAAVKQHAEHLLAIANHFDSDYFAPEERP